MKVYKTQDEVEKDIKDGVLAINGDVTFECSISIDAKIIVTSGNINAGNIKAGNIISGNIISGNITSGNINAWNINAWNINALDIKAGNIKALDIDALDIKAGNIDALDISYYAFCSVYQSIKCLSIKARRTPSSPPICLEGKIEIKEASLSGKEVSVEVEGKVYKAIII
jgi:hypothetical protein